MTTTLTTLRAAKSALEMQQTGLQWYRGMMPEYVDGSDYEADAETSSAITDLRTLIASMEAQPEPSPVMLKVVRGDICCKSLDMDQSYGMWVPVTYSAEHGFVDGTCFYTTAQPSEPKAEPAHDDLTIAYLAGFHAGRKAKVEPVQECDSPELCRISGSCAGQYGTKKICAQHAAAPQARKPLTLEQIDDIWVEHGCDGEDAIGFARAVEKAHGIEGGAA